MVKKITNKTNKRVKTTTRKTSSLTVPVINLTGEKVGVLDVPKEIADIRPNRALLAQAVHVYLASQRQGTACSKTRAEVSGGGRKPWKEKGTGRARQGSIRAPQWRSGGIVFGPKPKDYSLVLPKKMRQLSFFTALLEQIKKQTVYVIDKVETISPKTSQLIKLVNSQKKTLIILDHPQKNIRRAASNLSYVTVKTFTNANAYDLLNNQKIFFTKAAFLTTTKMGKNSQTREN